MHCTLDKFVDDYDTVWMEVVIPIQNDDFSLPQMIKEIDSDTYKKPLLEDKAIISAFNSRSNLSTVGCDVICNGVWKRNQYTNNYIIQHILSSGKFPSNLKNCKQLYYIKKVIQTLLARGGQLQSRQLYIESQYATFLAQCKLSILKEDLSVIN